MKNGNSRKRTFAILSEIVEIDSEKFWKFIKKFYAIKSRKELSEKQWRSIADRLDAAKRDKDVLDKLLAKLDEEETDIEITKPYAIVEGEEVEIESLDPEIPLDKLMLDKGLNFDEAAELINSVIFENPQLEESRNNILKELVKEDVEEEQRDEVTSGADLGLIDTEIEVDLEPKDIRDHFLKTHKDEIKGYIGCGFSERQEKYGIRVYVEDKEESGIHDMKSYMKIPVTVVDSGEFHHWLGKGIHGLNQDALEVKINA